MAQEIDKRIAKIADALVSGKIDASTAVRRLVKEGMDEEQARRNVSLMDSVDIPIKAPTK